MTQTLGSVDQVLRPMAFAILQAAAMKRALKKMNNLIIRAFHAFCRMAL